MVSWESKGAVEQMEEAIKGGYYSVRRVDRDAGVLTNGHCANWLSKLRGRHPLRVV